MERYTLETHGMKLRHLWESYQFDLIVSFSVVSRSFSKLQRFEKVRVINTFETACTVPVELNSCFRLPAHHDQQAIQEKLDVARHELNEEHALLERLKRETSARADQDRAALNQVRDELARLHSKMEDAR